MQINLKHIIAIIFFSLIRILNIDAQVSVSINIDSIVSLHNALKRSCMISERSGNHDDAISYATQDVDLLYKNFGATHKEFINALEFLGILYASVKDYKNSILVYDDLIYFCTRDLSQYETKYLDASLLYAQWLYISHRYDESIASVMSLLHYLSEKGVVKNNKIKFATDATKILGRCLMYQGEYVRAIETFKLISKNSTSVEIYADALRWVACNYSHLGDNVTAISIAQKAYYTLMDNKSVDYDLSTGLLIDIASYYLYLFDYEKTKELLMEAKSNIERFGIASNSSLYADYSYIDAAINLGYKEYEKAIVAGKRACEIYMQNVEMDSPTMINAINLLSLIYTETPNTQYAVELAEYAHQCILYNDSINNFTRLIDNDKNLCYAYYKNKNYDKALKCAYEFILNSGLFLYKNIRLSNENERKLIWQKEHNEFVYDLPLKKDVINNITNQNLLGRCLYDIALLTKGLLLSSDIQMQKILFEGNNRKIINSIDSLINIQNNNKYNVNDFVLNNKIEELYKSIRFNNQENSELKRMLKSSWKDVQSKMNKNDVSIEFLLLSDSTIIAVCLRKDWLTPQYITLCKKDEILQETNNINTFFETTTVWDKIWKPIFSFANIKMEDTVYFSPIDILQQINIESVKIYSNQFLSEKYNLIRVSSTKNIDNYKKNESFPLTCVLYGGIDYDTEVDKHELYNDDNLFRGIKDSIDNVRGMYDYLPGSKVEVDSIEQLLLHANIPCESIKKYDGRTGTEQSFKNLSSKAPQILHFSTHSYYVQPTKEELRFAGMTDAEKLLISYNCNLYDMIDYGLNRTGLLLSGARNSLRNNIDSSCDGILTAKEISEIDLNGTSLLILSSCQSGLGTMTYDGISGLQRGFKIAGVKTIIMSLWNVDDYATSYMMINFYTELLRTGSKYKAFKYAQSKVREKYEKPYYWASFIILD